MQDVRSGGHVRCSNPGRRRTSSTSPARSPRTSASSRNWSATPPALRPEFRGQFLAAHADVPPVRLSALQHVKNRPALASSGVAKDRHAAQFHPVRVEDHLAALEGSRRRRLGLDRCWLAGKAAGVLGAGRPGWPLRPPPFAGPEPLAGRAFTHEPGGKVHHLRRLYAAPVVGRYEDDGRRRIVAMGRADLVQELPAILGGLDTASGTGGNIEVQQGEPAGFVKDKDFVPPLDRTPGCSRGGACPAFRILPVARQSRLCGKGEATSVERQRKRRCAAEKTEKPQQLG